MGGGVKQLLDEPIFLQQGNGSRIVDISLEMVEFGAF